MARIPLLTNKEDVAEDKQHIVEEIMGSRGGRISGPFSVLLHNPEAEVARPIWEAPCDSSPPYLTPCGKWPSTQRQERTTVGTSGLVMQSWRCPSV